MTGCHSFHLLPMNSHVDNSKPRLITLSNVCLSRDGREILSDVNLDVALNDFIAITGPNGGGKTTLLRIMLKLLKPDHGNVEYHHIGGRQLRIGYLPQKNMIDSHFPISVKDVVAAGLLGLRNINGPEKEDRILAMLHLVGMENHADRPIGMLSGGQLQRALLGRAMISQPNLLVLDEPLSYLDKTFEERFYKIIAEIKSSTTVVLVSHEMTAIAEMATRHLIVDRTLHECHAHHHYVKSECE